MYTKLIYLYVFAGFIFISNDCKSISFQNFEPLQLNVSIEKCKLYNEIWTGKECYEIFTKGPCKDDEALVLDKEKFVKNEGVLKPVCKKKLCVNYDEVWWSELGMCIKKDMAKSMFCNHTDLYVTTNLFGEGVCSCWRSDYGLIEESCQEFYKRGLCNDSEVLTYDILTGNAVCKQDKCLHKNGNNVSIREISSNVSYYAPMYGTGECYELESQGPCDLNSVYEVQGVFHVPKCFQKVEIAPSFGIVAPDLCHIENGKCKDSVSIANQPGWDD